MEEWTNQFLAPLGGALKRYPKGRKRSHRTDDEEFYCLPKARRSSWRFQLCGYTFTTFCGKPPLAVLNRDEAIALFLPIILDRISADLILSCDKEVGNDLLAHYTSQFLRC